MIDLPPRLAADVARFEGWGAACRGGRCAYQNLAATEARPPAPVDGFERCTGYLGILHLEHGQPLLRVRECARRVAWGVRRAAWLAEERHRQRERVPARERPGWRRGAEPSGEETP